MIKAKPRKVNGKKATADIRVYCDPELKRVADHRADELGIPLSELTVRALAQFVGRVDLSEVPRKRSGRPRVKHSNGRQVRRRVIGRPRNPIPA